MKLLFAVAGLIAAVPCPSAECSHAAAPAALNTAADTVPGPRNATVPVVLTASGGSSQGSYQGGVNWALIEFLRRTASEPGFAATLGIPPHELVVATGASAGNINSLASVLEWCRAGSAQAPEHSLFWKTWVRTGFEQLFSDDSRQGIKPEALFHRAYIQKVHGEELIARSRAPQRSDCSAPSGIQIGITLTKLQAEAVPLARMEVVTQRFATALTAHGEAGNEDFPGMVFTQPDSSTRADASFGKLIALPSDRRGHISFGNLFAAVEASSAFPLAFPPRQLEFYRFDELLPDGSCPPEPYGTCRAPERDFFIDGGVFDNSPLDLGVGLYQKLREVSPDDRFSEPLIIIIEPDLHREPLREVRIRARSGTTSAEGVDALILLAKNIVPSARQYELHALTRALARDSTYAKPHWIEVTDRSFPVMGEHLHAFAGFLGKPFREFDFYVGVYDGLHFLARRVICWPRDRHEAVRARALDGLAERQWEQCSQQRLRELIEGRHLELGDLAPLVMAELYAVEYPQAQPPTIRRQPADEDKALVMAALVRAIRGGLSPVDEERCMANKHLVDRILCADGFRSILREFTTPSVRQVIEKWANEPGCGVGAMNAPDSCEADRTLAELVRDPERFAHRTIQRLIHQAWRVEAERSEARNYAALLKFLELAYRSTGLRYARGVELDPSSIPDRLPWRWRAMKFLPYYVAGALGAPGLEFGYRPTLHLGNHLAVVFPLTPLHYNTMRPEIPYRSYLAAGAGVGYKHSGLFFSGADLALQVMQPWRTLPEAFADAALGGEVSGYILGGKMRLGLRALPENTTAVHGGREWTVTVGISDFNGLLYWMLR